MNSVGNLRAVFAMDMKTICRKICKGFTLVELLVVIAILGVVMTMAAGVLRDAGKGRGIESGVELLESMVMEARATALGNDTYTRLVIVADPKDTSQDTIHLRYLLVQRFEKGDGKTAFDGTDVAQAGKWKSTSSGVLLPPGVYFCPTYSKPLPREDGSVDSMIGQGVTSIARRGRARIYYVEFDEKGRFVAPMADPLNPTCPQRLVLINGRPGAGRNAVDGIVPRDTVREGRTSRPTGAKGICLWPSGDVSLLRTEEQVFQDIK
ncbi:MAG: prepilin-type N-terminal cleavage/methylation domain-containing protein [Akkermansia sp.]|nr:prepilin-type N-terminal cleavage/methylation domain-containing protein [Akkermansia sp.]